MKFTNYLTSMKDIETYPIISILLFVFFFLLLILYVAKADKKHIAELKNIPLK